MVIEIEMIGCFQEGSITPFRFRFTHSSMERLVVKIDRIVSVEDERLAGNHMRVYMCESIDNGIKIIYKLKYEVRTCRWFLYTK